jgi:tetratricopeptide (TPR) repeat protein
MKRWMLLVLAGALLALPLWAAAQTATTLPFDPLTATPKPAEDALAAQAEAADGGAVLERAELAADRAEFAAAQTTFALEQASAAVDRADSMLNQFQTLEAVIGIIGFVTPILLVLAAVLGLNRLNSAQQELKAVHTEMDAEIARARSSAGEEISAVRKEAMKEIGLAKQQLNEELDRRQRDLEELKESAAAVRQEAAGARLASALLPLGEQQYKASDLEGAITTYERALMLDDLNPVTHYRLGYVYNRLGRFDEALERLAAALEIDKEFMPARAAIGYTYRRMAEALPPSDDQRELLFSEAENRLRDALTKAPNLVDDDGESWWGSLGGLYKRRGQFELAKDAYRRGGRVTPHSSYTFMNLAVLEMQDRNHEEMLRAFRHVERVARAETQARAGNYYGLADLMTAQLALGKPAEAQETMAALFEVAPEAENVLELEVDTLRRMLASLEGRPEAAAVARAITQIEAEQARRAAQAP